MTDIRTFIVHVAHDDHQLARTITAAALDSYDIEHRIISDDPEDDEETRVGCPEWDTP